MGKGDKRTKKGKIKSGSFGNSRKHKIKSEVTYTAKAPVKKVSEEKVLEELVKSESPKKAKKTTKTTKKSAKTTKKTTKKTAKATKKTTKE